MAKVVNNVQHAQNAQVGQLAQNAPIGTGLHPTKETMEAASQEEGGVSGGQPEEPEIYAEHEQRPELIGGKPLAPDLLSQLSQINQASSIASTAPKQEDTPHAKASSMSTAIANADARLAELNGPQRPTVTTSDTGIKAPDALANTRAAVASGEASTNEIENLPVEQPVEQPESKAQTPVAPQVQTPAQPQQQPVIAQAPQLQQSQQKQTKGKKKSKQQQPPTSNVGQAPNQQNAQTQQNQSNQRNAQRPGSSVPNDVILDSVVFPDQLRTKGVTVGESVYKKAKGNAEKIFNAVTRSLFNRRENTKGTKVNDFTQPVAGETLDQAVARQRTANNAAFKKQLKAREDIQRFCRNSWMLRVEGSTYKIVKNANNTYTVSYSLPKRAEETLHRVATDLNWDESWIYDTIIKKGGIGVDTSGKLGGFWHGKRKLEDLKISEDEFVSLVNDIELSVRMFGHPFGYTGKDITVHGTKCYPIGFISKEFAQKIINRNANANPEYQTMAGISADELQARVKDSWDRVTHPQILHETVDNKAQRWALYNMNLALLEEAGEDASAFGLSYMTDTAIDAIWSEMETAKASGDPDLVEALQQRAELQGKAFRDWLSRYYNINQTKDINGNTLSYQLSYKGRNIDRAFGAIASFERMNGTIFDPALFLANELEHLNGTFITKASNYLLGRQVTTDPNYQYSDVIKNETISDKGKASYKLINLASINGGKVVLQAFKDTGREFTEANFKEFLMQVRNGLYDDNIHMTPAQKSSLKFKATSLMDKITDVAMTGDLFFAGVDASNFMQVTMLNMAAAASHGGTSLTTKTVEDSIRSQGIEKTMLDLALTPEGWDAFIASKNQNGGRITPLGHAVEKLLRRSGFGDFMVTNLVDKYIRYNITFLQLFIPFSNTMSYLAVNQITKGKTFSDIRDYQLGGYELNNAELGDQEAFLRGLKKNVAYDVARLGSTGAICLFFMALNLMLGFEEPEDPSLRYEWREWLVGDKVWVPAWWLNDIVSWGLPLGTAFAVALTHPNEPELFFAVLVDGLTAMMDGNIVVDFVDFLTHGTDDIERIGHMIEGEEYGAPPSMDSYLAMLAEGKVAEFMKNITPFTRPVNWIYGGRESVLFGDKMSEAAASKIYDTENYSMEQAQAEGRTVTVDDWADKRRRELSKDNILYAMFNNLTKNGANPFFGTTDENTGYLSWEMPHQTYKDAIRQDCIDRYDFDPNDPALALAEDGGASIKEEHASKLIAELEGEYKTPENFIAQGKLLPYNARTNLGDYCFGQIYNASVELTEAKRTLDDLEVEIYGSEEYQYLKDTYQWYGSDLWQTLDNAYRAKDDAYAKYKETCDYYYDIIDKWVTNEDIPWSDAGYEVLKTDYNEVYNWIATGEPATVLDYWINPDLVEKRFMRVGNAPSSLLPFTTVSASNDTGYNFETNANWYVPELSDTQAIFDENEGRVVQKGVNTGRDLNSVLFGGSNDSPNATDRTYAITPHAAGEEVEGYGIPSSGMRGVVAAEGALPDSLKNFNYEAWLEKNGLSDPLEEDKKNDTDDDTDDTDSTTSSKKKGYGTYGYKRGGGGTNYSPKIYAFSRNISYDRAATMYNTRPYSTTLTYLRPSFETKGSRDAYKRQDI